LIILCKNIRLEIGFISFIGPASHKYPLQRDIFC
jgi:hypothetical protein